MVTSAKLPDSQVLISQDCKKILINVPNGTLNNTKLADKILDLYNLKKKLFPDADLKVTELEQLNH